MQLRGDSRGASRGALVLALVFVGALPITARPTTPTRGEDSSTKLPGHVKTDRSYEPHSMVTPGLESSGEVVVVLTEGVSPAEQRSSLLGSSSLPAQDAENGGMTSVLHRATDSGLQAAGVAQPTSQGDSTYPGSINVKSAVSDGETAPEPAAMGTSIESESSTPTVSTVEANKVTSEPSKVDQVPKPQELVAALASVIPPPRPAAMLAGGGKVVPPQLAVFANPNYGFPPLGQHPYPTGIPYDLGYIRPDELGGIPQIQFPFPMPNVDYPSDADGYTTYKPLYIANRMKVDKFKRQTFPSPGDKIRQIVNALRQIGLFSQFGNNVNNPLPAAPSVPLQA